MLGEFQIEIVTSSQAVVEAMKSLKDSSVITTRNLTGEVVVVLSIALPMASMIIKEVEKFSKIAKRRFVHKS